MYVQKAERKNRTEEEVNQIICWLTGYSQEELQRQIELESDFVQLLRPSAIVQSKCLAYQRCCVWCTLWKTLKTH